MEIVFLIDGFYLVDAISGEVVEGPFETPVQAEVVMNEIMAPAHWE